MMCAGTFGGLVVVAASSRVAGFQEWFSGLGLDPNVVVGATVAVVVLVVVLIVLVRKRAPRSMAEELARRGCQYLHNVMLPDGLGDEIHLDFLVLTQTALMVMDVKDYRGVLFGGAQTDQWTQLVNRRSYRFDNPLFHNQLRVATVKTLLGDVPVRGCVAFTEVGRFPRGMPDGVHMQSQLLSQLQCPSEENAVPVKLRLAWAHLKQQARRLS